MAKCYITWEVGVDESHVEAIRTCLSERGHEVMNDDIINDEEVWHVEIDGDYVKVRKIGADRPEAAYLMPSNTIKLNDSLDLKLPPKDEKPIEERIEDLCDKLHKHFVLS